jgi:hypothetical protein
VTGANFDPSGFAKKMTGISKSFEAMGGTVGNLSGIFKSLGLVASRLVTFLGGFAAALLAAAIAADAYDKEIKSKLLKGVGAAGLGGLDEATKASSGQAALGTFGPGGLRATSEELQTMNNTLMKSDVTIQALGGNVNDFNKITKQSAVLARNFGLEMGEGAQIAGEYFQTYGAGSDTIKKTFDTMTKSMRESNMSSTSFLGIMKSVSSQFSIFTDQTAAFSSIIGKLGKSGERTTKQIEESAKAMASFGEISLEDAIKSAALNKKGLVEQAKKRAAQLLVQIKDSQDPREKVRLQEQLEATNDVASGDTLKMASGMQRGGSTASDQIAAVLDKMGVTTVKQLHELEGNTAALKVLEQITGKSDKDNLMMLKGVETVARTSGKTNDSALGDVAKLLEEQKAAGPRESEELANKIASETVPRTAALAEVGNALLYQLVKGLNALIGFVKLMANKILHPFANDKQLDEMAKKQAKQEADNKRKELAEQLKKGTISKAGYEDQMRKISEDPAGDSLTTNIMDAVQAFAGNIASTKTTAAEMAAHSQRAGAGPLAQATQENLTGPQQQYLSGKSTLPADGGTGSNYKPEIKVDVRIGNEQLNNHIHKVSYGREQNNGGKR